MSSPSDASVAIDWTTAPDCCSRRLLTELANGGIYADVRVRSNGPCLVMGTGLVLSAISSPAHVWVPVIGGYRFADPFVHPGSQNPRRKTAEHRVPQDDWNLPTRRRLINSTAS